MLFRSALFRRRNWRTRYGRRGIQWKDGRTTIFDYWSVDKIRRWNNNGAWDSSKLTAQEKKLRDFHQKLLTHCNSEMAIREGLFFDLTYANFDNDAYNPALNYAYLRKSDNELIVVITNFDDKKSVIGVKIPNHAFEYLKIKPGKYTGTDILTDKSLKYSLFPDNLFVATVPANSGILIKFNLNGDKDEKTKKIEGNAK